MITQVRKWGNSLGIRIPKSLASDVQVEDGSSVNLTVDDGRLLIVPVAGEEKTLEELLDQITPENLHGETETGKPAGREVW